MVKTYKIRSICVCTILRSNFTAVIVRTLWKPYELSLLKAVFCNQYVQHHPCMMTNNVSIRCYHQVDIFGGFRCIMLYTMHVMVRDYTSHCSWSATHIASKVCLTSFSLFFEAKSYMITPQYQPFYDGNTSAHCRANLHVTLYRTMWRVF